MSDKCEYWIDECAKLQVKVEELESQRDNFKDGFLCADTACRAAIEHVDELKKRIEAGLNCKRYTVTEGERRGGTQDGVQMYYTLESATGKLMLAEDVLKALGGSDE